MGANDTLEQLRAAQAYVVELEAEVDDLKRWWGRSVRATEKRAAERDALAAAIEQALAAYEWAVDAGEALEYMLRALKAAPSRVLAERDAEKWDEGFSAALSRAFNDPPSVNPYRTRKETD